MTTIGERAIVMGASVGGLLAARVLADYYERVTVVERDVLPDDAVNRRGVPQGRMIHAVQARGSQITEELFPGFLHELAAAGVATWHGRDFSKIAIAVGGHRLVRSGIGASAQSMKIVFPSRPLLEWNLRRRVAAVANVRLLEGYDVAGLVMKPDHRRVTGARVINRCTGGETSLTADLVVDATGRGSRTPTILEEFGYNRPPEKELTVHLRYACQMMRIPPDSIPEHMIAIFPEPGRPTMFGAIGYENNTWMFGVGTMAGQRPPGHRDDMAAFAADFAPPHALRALQAGEPLSDVAYYHVPSNRWRRYDKMRRFPAGFLVFGDAVCSFNPIYGQGMTVAAMEALVLRDCLRRGEQDLARRFFRANAKNLRVAWQTAVGSDLALPEVVGRRPISMRVSNAYLEAVLTAAETDVAAAQQFMRVIGMIDPPLKLLSPKFILRIASAGRRKRAALPVRGESADPLVMPVGPR
jgi:2-polyprenyl-6-methoxyphenol hydroxylase-like FAD-dependent oxidoreductase